MVTVAIGPILAKAASMDASSADCGMLRTNTAVTGSCVSFSCVVLCAGAGSAEDAAGALGGAAGLGLDTALGALAAAAARIFAAMDAYVVGPSGSFASVSGSTMAAAASGAAAAASAASLTTSAAALALACTFGAAAFILASSSSRDTAPVGRVGAGGAVVGGSGAFTGADTAVSADTGSGTGACLFVGTGAVTPAMSLRISSSPISSSRVSRNSLLTSCSSLIVGWNARRVWPSCLAMSASPFGPKTRRATTPMTSASGAPTPNRLALVWTERRRAMVTGARDLTASIAAASPPLKWRCVRLRL
mmetsp:Transcript_3552/g.9504  ORF Transcript_3552/g.9504 Transcript_3552/m.9504 type:complete len:305 (-) Transcript_3552:178-1092(-)